MNPTHKVILTIIDGITVLLHTAIEIMLCTCRIPMEDTQKILLISLSFTENFISVANIIGDVAGMNILLHVYHPMRVIHLDYYLHMIYLTVDRFLLIFFNIKYPLYFSRKRAVVLCVATHVTIAGFAVANKLSPVLGHPPGSEMRVYIALDIAFLGLFVATYSYIFYHLFLKEDRMRLVSKRLNKSSSSLCLGRNDTNRTILPKEDDVFQEDAGVNHIADDSDSIKAEDFLETVSEENKIDFFPKLICPNEEQLSHKSLHKYVRYLPSQGEADGIVVHFNSNKSTTHLQLQQKQQLLEINEATTNKNDSDIHKDLKNGMQTSRESPKKKPVTANKSSNRTVSFVKRMVRSRFFLIWIICLTFITFNVTPDVLGKIFTDCECEWIWYMYSLSTTTDAVCYFLVERNIRRFIRRRWKRKWQSLETSLGWTCT